MATKYSYLSIGVFTEIILLDSLNEIGLECFVQMFVLILMNSFRLIFRNYSFWNVLCKIHTDEIQEINFDDESIRTMNEWPEIPKLCQYRLHLNRTICFIRGERWPGLVSNVLDLSRLMNWMIVRSPQVGPPTVNSIASKVIAVFINI